jgi:hypothetical protein
MTEDSVCYEKKWSYCIYEFFTVLYVILFVSSNAE